MSLRLDCGHMLDAKYTAPGYTGGAGYGTDQHGLKSCYECCGKKDREAMIRDGKAVLYLSKVQTMPDQWEVTNWPGTLRFEVFHVVRRKERSGFCGVLDVIRCRFRGPDGRLWSAVNKGDNQIARCMRLKERSK